VLDSVTTTDSGQLDAPIVIIGAPRSGTTILSRLLEAHPSLALIGEPRLTWRHGNERKSDMLSAEDARSDVIAFIRDRFTQETLSQGKRRFVEKSPQNSLRVDFVNKVFPDSKIIHIIRDGRDSTLSIFDHWNRFSGGVPKRWLGRRLREVEWRRAPFHAKDLIRRALPSAMSPVVGPRLWGPRIPGLEQLVRELKLIEVCALQWRMCVEAGCHRGRLLPDDRYMECRLEDFSPELIRKVMDFCGLEDDGAVWKKYEERYDPTRLGDRRAARATPEEIETIMEWIEPTLRWLGYR
jgi:hypothetical protein